MSTYHAEKNGYKPPEAQQMRGENPFLPRVDRSTFLGNIGTLMGSRVTYMDDDAVDTNVRPGEKVSYNGKLSPLEFAAEERHFGMNYYNAAEIGDGETAALHLEDEEHREIHDQALLALRERGVRVVNPFAKEPDWLGGVLDYTIGRLGADHVHPCHAGICDISHEIARKSGAQVFEQQKILQQIDYGKLKRLELLPQDYTPKGSKGMTMYTALLGLAANNLLDGPVAFMDTDIPNPGPASGYGKRGDYLPLDYLGLPLADKNQDPSKVLAVFMARGGEGRNNHTVKGALQRALDDTTDPFLQAMAWNVIKRTWLLSGEFLLDPSLLETLPFPTDMGIEIMTAIHVSGHELERGEPIQNQTPNPNNKDSGDESNEEREFGSILYPVQTALESANQMLRWTGRPTHRWDHQDLGLYNMHFGGQRRRTVVNNNSLHGRQKMRSYTTGLLMPSIKMMKDLDAVDFDAIQRMSNGVNQTNFYL